jgi:hypothetical protein
VSAPRVPHEGGRMLIRVLKLLGGAFMLALLVASVD